MNLRKALGPSVSKDVDASNDHVKASDYIDTIDDQVKASVYHNDSVTFDYELNDKAAKAKLVKGSKRIPLEIEEKFYIHEHRFQCGSLAHNCSASD